MSGDWLSLQNLVAPVALDRFRRECWDRKAVVARGPITRFGPLAAVAGTWTAEAALLAHREPVTVCYPRPWLRGVRPAPAPTANFLPDEGLVLHGLGAAIYVRRFERFEPALNRALAGLRGSVGSATAVACELLLTGSALPAAVPLPPGPVFLIQLRGEQSWAVAGAVVGVTRRSGVAGLRMRPGTVLYLPRGGARLTASTADAATLVLSVPVVSAVEPVLQGVIEGMLRVEALRAPALVPPTAAGRRLALAAAGRALTAVPMALADLQPRRLLADAHGRRFSRVPAARATLGLDAAAGMSVLGVRARRQPPTEITLDAGLAHACEWILDQLDGFSEEAVRMAVGLDAADLQRLLDVLVEVGLLHEHRR